jgi:membrane protease YdiL (CAAX protease family)
MVDKSISANIERVEPRLQPLSWVLSSLILLLIGTLYYLAFHYLIPDILKRTGQPYLVAYLWVWGGSMGLILSVSLFLYLLEGYPLTWTAFATRYRLERMSGKDWLWALAVLIVTAGCYFGLSGTARWLASMPVFAPVPLAPAELRPDVAGNLIPGQFFGIAVQGQWWVVIVYFIGWIFNILGEEFFYRSWILPRQELAFGKYAWLVNGTMFTFQHWMQPFNFLAIWPGALFMAWAIQHRRNTWIGILQHGLLNFGALVMLIQWVIG